MQPKDKTSFKASLNGIPGILYFDGLILRHEDPHNPESYRQSISILHVSRIAYGVKRRSIWPLILGFLFLIIGVALFAFQLADMGVVAVILGIIIGITYFFAMDRISAEIETPHSKYEITIEGDAKFLREFYLRLETVWLVAQSRLAGAKSVSL